MANETNMRDLDGNAIPTVADVRRLQRAGKALRKRFLSVTKNAADIAKRDAVDYANACGWNNPSPGATEARSLAWARRWMELYRGQLGRLLAGSVS